MFRIDALFNLEGTVRNVPKQVRIPEFGGLAQLGERLPCKQEVTGSIPVLSTISGDPDKAQRSGFVGERRNKATVEHLMLA